MFLSLSCLFVCLFACCLFVCLFFRHLKSTQLPTLGWFGNGMWGVSVGEGEGGGGGVGHVTAIGHVRREEIDKERRCFESFHFYLHVDACVRACALRVRLCVRVSNDSSQLMTDDVIDPRP